jgi:Wzt C-terminal domain
VIFDLHVDADRPVSTKNLHIRLDVLTSYGGPLIGLSTFFEPDNPLRDIDVVEPGTTISCVLDELPLTPGHYFLSASVERLNEVLDRALNVLEFTILPSDFYATGVLPPEHHHPVLVRHRWRVTELSPAAVGRR